jgi:phospholipid transport system substrate-binding protein
MLRYVTTLALATLALVSAVSPASAGPAQDRIRAFFGDVNRLLVDPAYEDRLPERLGAVRALVGELVDFRSAAVLALGSEWDARTSAEQGEFARLFADLLQTSVLSSIGGRARIANGLSVTYIGELPDRDGVTVATGVLMRTGAEMGVGYRMTERNGRWKVYDVVLDGVSLVDNYRAQFHKVIGRTSYADLVNEIRARLAELGGPAATAAAAGTAPVAVVPVAAQAVVAARRPAEAPAVAPPPVLPVISTTPAVTPPDPPTVKAREWTPVITRDTTLDSADVAPAAPPAVAEKPSVAPPVNGSAASAMKSVAPRIVRSVAYWIQVAAFSSTERLVSTATALRDQAVTLVTDPDQPLTRVMVGPFTDRSVATSKVRELRARGYEAFIAAK